MSQPTAVPHVLIVDDEEAVCWALERGLTRDGFSVTTTSSAEEAFTLAEQRRPDVIILDVRLPGLDGLAALAKLRESAGGAPVVIITAFGNLATAVKAVQEGAFDYLTKPFDYEQALKVVGRAVQTRPSRPDDLQPKVAGVEAEEIVGRGPAMQVVFRRIALVAPREACVLITGESGTGKELVARAIHRYSGRADSPFLAIHVAALNPQIVESELFGHIKGAFTGADQAHTGLLKLADGGTVFLDELADIPLPVQVKLLRVLEQGELFPVGSTQAVPLNFRLLAATHQDLTRKVQDGSFRHDLFFRVNVFEIHLPPLRERMEDLPLLVEHFLRRLRSTSSLPRETLDYLAKQPWPGNVRELRNALEHAVIVAQGGPLLPEHLPAPGATPLLPDDQLRQVLAEWVRQQIARNTGDLYQETIRLAEATLLAEVMRCVDGNRVQAARMLGLSRTTLRKKLAELGLAPPESAENKLDPE
jgi:two-component system, NtrC family, nitrogen regulation response regulator GlnG